MTRIAGCVMTVVMYCVVISAPGCSTSSAQDYPKPLREMKSGFVLCARSATALYNNYCVNKPSNVSILHCISCKLLHINCAKMDSDVHVRAREKRKDIRKLAELS